MLKIVLNLELYIGIAIKNNWIVLRTFQMANYEFAFIS